MGNNYRHVCLFLMTLHLGSLCDFSNIFLPNTMVVRSYASQHT